MAYTNSPLVDYTLISPHRTKNRNHAIDTITIHCVVGQTSVQTLGSIFQSKEASSNYGIGYDGKVGMYVEEKDRSWCSSNAANDHRAVTIEVASGAKEPYEINTKAYEKLIQLVADICYRNGIKRLLWKGDKSLVGQVDKQNMTWHCWFNSGKSCPGTWLKNKHPEIVTKVNAILATREIADNKEKEPAPSTPSTPSTSKLAGQAVILSKTPLYASSTVTNATSYVTGTYYYWSSEIVNKRIRITNAKSRVGIAGQVTGWIAAPTGASAPATSDLISPSTLKAGQIFKVTNVPIYGSSTNTKAAKTITGTYYLWSTQIVSGRIRVTNALSRVGVSGQVTGWVNVSDLGIAAKKSVDEVAREVIDGKWGNGTERKKKLEAAGYNYSEVQARVNKLLGK